MIYKKFKIQYLLSMLMMLAITVFVAIPALASADAVEGLNKAATGGYNGSAQSSVSGNSGFIQSIPGAIGKIVGLALSFIGLAFLLLMIYGGFIWMFARGNDQDVQKAKDLIQSAIIGLIIVMAAYAITMFIGTALTGDDISTEPRITLQEFNVKYV